VYKKAGYKTVFKSNANLQTILTAKNKVKLPKNSQPGVYKIQCKCENVPPYIGETKLKINTRYNQHQSYVRNGHWDNSGAAKHAEKCEVGFEEVKTIKVENRYFDRCVREALEIQNHGINLDYGKYVKTKFWLPLMRHLTEEDKKKQVKGKKDAIQRTSNRRLTSNN